MLHGVKYFNNDVFYLMKKHHCPECGAKLEKVKISRIVNSKSPEAEKFDFQIGDGWASGDVKFTWKELRCPKCDKHYTIDEMKKAEKG